MAFLLRVAILLTFTFKRASFLYYITYFNITNIYVKSFRIKFGTPDFLTIGRDCRTKNRNSRGTERKSRKLSPTPEKKQIKTNEIW